MGSDEGIEEVYNIKRSMRLGAQTKAREEGVTTDMIDLVIRRRKVKAHCGSKPNGPIRDYYTEVSFLCKSFLPYPLAL